MNIAPAIDSLPLKALVSDGFIQQNCKAIPHRHTKVFFIHKTNNNSPLPPQITHCNTDGCEPTQIKALCPQTTTAGDRI